MADPNLFAQAISFHRAGRLNEAEAAYRAILTDEPGHADSLHLLGVVAHQKGNHIDAVSLIQQAIGLQPGVLNTTVYLLGAMSE